MHELGLCDGIVEAVLRRAAGRRVSAARVRIGGHPVDPEVMEQGFALAAMGTPAEGAALDVVSEPSTVHCRGCGSRAPVADHLALVACRACGGVDVEVVGSDEAVLESITLAADSQEERWTRSSS